MIYLSSLLNYAYLLDELVNHWVKMKNLKPK